MKEPIIQVKDLTKSYGDFEAVRGISFEVYKGEIFGLLGPNGAGKSTTLEIIETLRQKSGGTVIVDGMNLDTDPEAIKKIIGVQLQTAGFYPNLNLTELIHLFVGLYQMEMDPMELLAKVDLVDKAKSTGNENILVCERGFSFGYNNLVSDMRSLVVLRETGCPVIFDGTHSLQLPGGKGNSSGGQREFIPPLARAATAVGIGGIFIETHPEPEKALSDGPNSFSLKDIESLLTDLKSIDELVKK